MSYLAKSPWVVHFNCNSCNGCDIEFVACLTPMYDLERFGVLHVGNPKHADVLVVTGSVNHRNVRVLRNIYNQIPEPKVVVGLGVCSSTGGIFADCYNVLGGVDKVVPVDVFVPGCPPRPEAIIDGLVVALKKLSAKSDGQSAAAAEKPKITFFPTEKPKSKG
ncbi:MAG: NADH-quinone oxidoreductase subunit B family protein [Thermodesulfobacteriota bacterium]